MNAKEPDPAPASSPALLEAWRRFAEYDSNAVLCQQRHVQLRRAVLALGVVATFLAILYSLLAPADGQPPGGPLRLLQWLVIAAPIATSLLLAGAVKFERASTWVLLRGAAETLKREIWSYRTRVGEYAPTPASAPADGAPPESPEACLARRIKGVAERLMKTEVNRAALLPCPDDVAPYAAEGDDRFSRPTAEQYLRWRLDDQVRFFQDRAGKLDKQLQQLQWSIYGLGGLGTFLAAIGFEVWIAVTTALAGALATWLELRRVESTITSYNQAASDLNDIRIWWHSLPAEAQADPANYRSLVEYSEAILANEGTGWIQTMQDTLAALYKTGTPPTRESPPTKPAAPAPVAPPENP